MIRKRGKVEKENKNKGYQRRARRQGRGAEKNKGNQRREGRGRRGEK